MERARTRRGALLLRGFGAGSVLDGALGRSIRRHVEAYDRLMWSSYRTREAPRVRNFPPEGQIPLASDVPEDRSGGRPELSGQLEKGKRPRAARNGSGRPSSPLW